jgi:TRAP-type transport system small permease protein
LNKHFYVIDTIIKYFLVLIVAVVSILGIYQVFTRYAFNNASTWSEELIRFLFVWASCVGAGVGIKENIHIGVDVLVNNLPIRLKEALRLFVLFILCVFGIFLIKYGLLLTMKTVNQLSPALQISMAYVYAAIPTLGGLTVFYSLREIVDVVKNLKEVSK